MPTSRWRSRRSPRIPQKPARPALRQPYSGERRRPRFTKRSALGGTFFEPTALTDVTTDMVITKEETFGPVAPLYRFQTDDKAIKMANDTPTLPSPASGGREG